MTKAIEYLCMCIYVCVLCVFCVCVLCVLCVLCVPAHVWMHAYMHDGWNFGKLLARLIIMDTKQTHKNN